jgi:hypothetical protein
VGVSIAASGRARSTSIFQWQNEKVVLFGYRPFSCRSLR